MTLKTQRDPLLPNVPSEDEALEPEVVTRFRKGHLEAFRDVVNDIHDDLTQLESTAEKKANKGAPNGYAPLNSSALVPPENLGTGTPSSNTYLRGDSQWAQISQVVTQKARGYRASTLSIPSAWTKVPIDTVSFDPDGIVDVTNGRIKPTKAGYYVVLGQVYITQLAANTIFAVALYKNGVEVAHGIDRQEQGTVGGLVVSDIIYFDGVNDYVELWCYASRNTSLNISLGGKTNYLSVGGLP